MRLKFYLVMLTCMVSMRACTLEPVDGVYQLVTAQDMVDFADMINGGTTDVKAVDITASATLAAVRMRLARKIEYPLPQKDYVTTLSTVITADTEKKN